MGTRRIPRNLSEVDVYINTVEDYLTTTEGTSTRGEKLGVLPAELVTLTQFKTTAHSGDPANPGVLDLHLNPTTKNRTTRANADEFLKNFGDFFRPILDRISGSPFITANDRIKLNIAEPGNTPTYPTTPIAEQCYALYKALGGGDIQFSFRSKPDSTRASKPVGADAVEIAGRVDARKMEVAPPDAGNDLAGKIKFITITGPNDGTTKVIYTKASFTVHLGAENSGNYLQFYARWTNTKHPELAGPWTGPIALLIV